MTESPTLRNLRFLVITTGLLLLRPAAPGGPQSRPRLLYDAGWMRTISEEIRRSEYRVSPGPAGFLTAPNRVQGVRSLFAEGGLSLTPRVADARERSTDRLAARRTKLRSIAGEGGPAAGVSAAAWEVGLRLGRFGRDGALAPVAAATPRSEGDRVEYRRGGLTEWYVNRPGGIEQGFTIPRRPGDAVDRRPGAGIAGPLAAAQPAKNGPLVIEMAVTGSARASAGCDGSSVVFMTEAGEEVLRYADLRVVDAEGRPVDSRLRVVTSAYRIPGFPEESGLRVAESRLRIEVSDDGAAYPLRIDPLLTTPSWTTESNQDSAHLGISVASAGDVNGDLFGDVVVSAPWYDANGFTDEGRVFVFLGSAAGLATTPAWTADGNQTSAFFGYSVASAGDVNKDGYGDLIVGDDSYTSTFTGEGKAVLYLGSATGLATTPAWVQYGGQTEASFGWSVASAGDVNHDGYGDVIIAADLYDVTAVGSDEGRVYLYLGSASGLATTPAWMANGPQTSDEFGWQVASAGDVNKDGFGDVIIGASLFDPSASQADAGKAYLYYGTASGLAATPAWTFVNGQKNSTFGYSVASAGDVNKDGYGDVLVGAPYYTNTATNEGRVYLFLGSPSGLSATTPSWTANGIQAGALFGNSVTSAGDVDGDGYSDVLVGSFFYDNGTLVDSGRAQLFQGTASGPTMLPVWTFAGPQAGAWVGWRVAPAGDVNRDGFSDVLVGAPVWANGQTAEGRAFLFAGSGTCVDLDGDGYGSPGGTGCRLGTVLDCNDANAAINPGATEICNGIDDNCDGKIDNALVPAGIPQLTVTPATGTNTTLSWTTISGATAYDIVLGDIGILNSTGGDYTQATQRCLMNDWTSTSIVDTHLPNPGQSYWFLVRAVNCGGAGTYDEGGGGQVGSRDAGIKASVGACP